MKHRAFTLRASEFELEPPPPSENPNGHPFTGILCRLDEPSDAPPGGSGGRLVLIPREVAERRLSTLLGMGVNYVPGTMDDHNEKFKIGAITGAWIDGNALKVSGLLYALNFPEAVSEIRAAVPDLGMSYEVDDVFVEDRNAKVWKVLDLKFTGAAILRKDTAAYRTTALAAKRGHGAGIKALEARVRLLSAALRTRGIAK